MKERPPPGSRIRGAGAGLALGVATWITLGVLGIPAIVGMGTFSDLPWVALAGAVLGALGLLAPIRVLLGLAVVAIFVVSYFPMLDNRIAAHVRSDPAPAGPVDAVVALSASLTTDERLSRNGVERLVGALALRSELGTRHVVVTTIRAVRLGDTLRSEGDQRRIASRLDPDAELHFVGPTRDTHDEALAVERLARSNGWKRVAVVTSPLHTRRACATFEATGLLVVCRPSRSEDYSLNPRRAPGDRLAGFRDWLYEVVGTRVYRSRGWLQRPANRNASATF